MVHSRQGEIGLATRPRDYKTVFMLNSNEHEISIARGKITIYSLKTLK